MRQAARAIQDVRRKDMDPWKIATAAYLAALIISFFPAWKAIRRKVELAPPGDAFQESPYFSDEAKQVLIQHYSRIRGTLGYWKNKAAMFKALHYYMLVWTIPSAVLIPTLTPFVTEGNASKTTVTVISAATAILLAFHRGLKVEDNLKAFRHGESEFYDLVRRILDRPELLGNSEKDRVTNYFDEVERIRRFVRNAETDNLATPDEARTQIEQMRKSNGA